MNDLGEIKLGSLSAAKKLNELYLRFPGFKEQLKTSENEVKQFVDKLIEKQSKAEHQLELEDKKTKSVRHVISVRGEQIEELEKTIAIKETSIKDSLAELNNRVLEAQEQYIKVQHEYDHSKSQKDIELKEPQLRIKRLQRNLGISRQRLSKTMENSQILVGNIRNIANEIQKINNDAPLLKLARQIDRLFNEETQLTAWLENEKDREKVNYFRNTLSEIMQKIEKIIGKVEVMEYDYRLEKRCQEYTVIVAKK